MRSGSYVLQLSAKVAPGLPPPLPSAVSSDSTGQGDAATPMIIATSTFQVQWTKDVKMSLAGGSLKSTAAAAGLEAEL